MRLARINPAVRSNLASVGNAGYLPVTLMTGETNCLIVRKR